MRIGYCLWPYLRPPPSVAPLRTTFLTSGVWALASAQRSARNLHQLPVADHAAMASLHEVPIPASNSSVSVSVIDTTSWAYKIPCGDLFRPRFPGLNTFDICSYAFLITHQDHHVLFDLGIRKDWENLIPGTYNRLKRDGTKVEVKKELVAILQDGGTDLSKIEAVVWSHIHWDHTGNLASLPGSIDLVVGPGIKEQYMPGWPTVSDAHFREADVAGRAIREVEDKAFNLEIGGLRAYDYFGDGSFYLLNAPGHAIGHLNALARTTTNPPTFMLLAADSVHLAGEFRPTEALPIPELVDVPAIIPRPCPCEDLENIHPLKSRTRPFLGLDPGFPDFLEEAEHTIECIKRFDADERVLVAFSHDIAIYKLLDFYPATANAWKEKGWKLAGRWAFLADLQKIARERDQEKAKHNEL